MRHLKIYIIIILLFLLFVSCPLTTNTIDNNDIYEIQIIDTPVELKSFVETYETPLHDYFYEYAIRYNRVNALINSLLFIDHNKNDRAHIISLNEASLREVDDFISFCKEMEQWGDNVFEPAVESTKKSISDNIFNNSKVAGMSDSAYARRLVEMYLDSSYGATFSPSDISRKTGIEMAKIRFLMQQISREFSTEVDIVNEEVIGEQVEFCETVRDTAGAVNSTLALATPLGAFGTATASVTTTAAAATGWIQKAKYASTVLENTSAAITFAGNVVNIAVKEDNIPTSVKTVTEYNSYVSLVFGGIGGFNGSSSEKALAIIGTTSDGVTTYIKIEDDGIKASERPQLSSTPDKIEIDSLDSALVKGDYKIPDEENINNWTFSDFDFDIKGENYWDDIYDGIEEMTSSTYREFEDEFKQFVEVWIENNDNNLTKSEIIDKENILPEFFNEGGDESFTSHQELDVPLSNSDFEVSISTLALKALVPYDATFSANLNNRFLYDNLKLYWDFGDGTSLTQTISEEGYNPEVNHKFSNEGVYTVSLRALDNRGYSAECEIEISVGNNLQEVIDSFKGKEAIVHVPPGAYTGGYSYGNVLKVWSGITLWGNKDSTFIDATVEMYPDSRIEGFTFRGGRYGVIIDTEDPSAINDIQSYDIEIVGNNFYAPEYQTAMWLSPIYDNDNNETPYTGEIKNNTSNGLGTFLLCGKFIGEVSYNNIKNTYNQKSTEFGGLADSLITNNNFINAGGIEIYGDIENSIISENSFVNTTNEASISIVGKLSSSSQLIDNEITKSVYSKGGMRINEISEGSKVSGNIIKDGNGLGISIEKVLGEFSNNEISNNTSEQSILIIRNILPTGVVSDNKLINNITNYNYIYPYSFSNLIVFSSEGSILNNTVSGNSGGGMSINYVKGNISGNNVTNNLNGGITVGAYEIEKPSFDFKNSNTISGNTCYDEDYYYVDLYTPWKEDRIPETPPDEN